MTDGTRMDATHPGAVVLGSHLGADERLATPEPDAGMHSDIAANWEAWSALLGRGVQTILEGIEAQLPELTAAMLTTADGLNLCSLGVPEQEVARLAALNSTLFAVSSAHSEATLGHAASPKDTFINISSGGKHTVIVSLVQEPLGQMLLALTSGDVNLGMLVYQAREGAEKVRAWLQES